MSAAEKVAQLQQQIGSLQDEQRTLVQYAGTVLQQAVQGYPHAAESAAISSSAPLDQQIEALKLLSVTQQYVGQLRQAAHGVRKLQQLIHSTQHSADDPEELVRQTAACADAYASCKAALSTLAAAEYPASAVPSSLRAAETQLQQQLQDALSHLRQQLSQQIHGYLAQCGWQPPITSSSAAAAEAEGHSDASHSFDVNSMFTSQHSHQVALLQRLLVAVTGLQQAEDRDAFQAVLKDIDAAAAAPILWAAQELAAPLSDKLLHHFGNDTPPGAVERPQWLLNTVLRLCKEYAPRLDFLQSVVQATDLHACYNFSVEFSRALRATAKQLLRDAKLPAVAAAGDSRLWLHYADCLSRFDEQLGPLLGLLVSPGAPLLPDALLQDGVMSVMAEHSSWMDAWLSAESATAAGMVDKLLYSPTSWDKAPSLVAEDRPPWQCELYPPAGAEQLVMEVESLLERARFIPQHAAKDRYLQEVVGSMLNLAQGRILRMLQQADLFKDVGGLVWVPKVCVCICFCHFVEVHLQELQEHLLLQLTRHNHSNPVANGNGGAGSRPPGPPLPPPAAAAAAASPGSGDAAAAGKAPQLQLLKSPLSEFASTRKEWVYKVAKAIGQGFAARAAGYMSRESLFKDAEAAGEGCVSGLLLDALSWLQMVLAMLAEHLDARCFRDTWRAIAATLNRELFNNVATEMIFSRAGAAQFATDVGALLRCFAPFTPKPQSHFKELLEAARLLGLEQGAVGQLQQLVSPVARTEASLQQATQMLAQLGIAHLEPDHVDTILSLRL